MNKRNEPLLTRALSFNSRPYNKGVANAAALSEGLAEASLSQKMANASNGDFSMAGSSMGSGLNLLSMNGGVSVANLSVRPGIIHVILCK